MKLLMISGDRSILQGKKGAFYYMLEEFTQHWDRIDVICPYSPKPYLVSEPVFGKVFFHASPHGIWYQPHWIAKKGWELIQKYQHSVMSVHEYPPFYNGLGAEWLSRRTQTPYVLEVHHVIGYPKASSFNELLGRWLSHLFLVNDSYGASAVRCVSRGTAAVLERWGARKESIFIIPSFYLDRAKLSENTAAEKRYDLVVCGRLVVNKGTDDLLRAVSRLPGVTLLIVGDGPKRAKLENLTQQLGISDRVEFLGWLPESADVFRAVQSAKLFVMNSRSEGGPRVALEAMALGMPVLTTKVGAMPDVIREEENGMFTTGTPADLVEKIDMLLKYPSLCDRLGSEARKILDKYERSEMIARYADFLKAHAKHSD